MIRFVLFGQPKVFLDDQEVVMPTRRALASVTYLSLEGTSSRAKLVELLWDDLEESRARTYLRRELNRLRLTTLRDRLEANLNTIGLIKPVTSDVAEFRAHLEAGAFEAALALLSGELLEGFELGDASGFMAWLEQTRDGVRQARSMALVAWSVQLEEHGDVRGALAARLELIRSDELQESHHREVMRLHAILGEREAALARFERLEHILKIELGLEPLPETVALVARIRAAEPLESLVADQTNQLGPSLSPPLIGRESAWSQLERSVTGLVLLEGEPGVGKTRLAEDFARLHGSSLILRAREDARGTALYPVAEVLRAALEHPEQRLKLERLPAMWRREVARLVPELEPDFAPSSSLPAAEGRSKFLEALARALTELVGEGGCLVFDDWQWLDGSSFELVAHLARRTSNHGLKLIATARSEELLENQAALKVLSSLERDGKLTRLPLEPLAETEVLSLVRALSGNTGGTLFAKRLHTATGGNPMFVLETVKHLFESESLRLEGNGWATPFDDITADYTELPTPPSVLEAVLRRVERLGSSTRRLLEAASLAGAEFQLEMLEGSTALSDWEGLEALEKALGAKLLEPQGFGYRFAHDLIRQALEQGLLPERRRLLHHKLADSLDRAGGAPSQIATHLEMAGRKLQAVPWRIRAAQAAEQFYAINEALEHYAKALDDGADDRTAFEVRFARSKLWITLNDLNARALEAVAMTELANRLNDPALQNTAAIENINLEFHTGHYDQAVLDADYILEGKQLLPEQLAQTWYVKGISLIRLGRLSQAETSLNAALEHETNQHSERAGNIQNGLCACAMQQGDLDRARAFNRAAQHAFETAGIRYGQANALMTAGGLATIAGDRQAAKHDLEQALFESREIGHVLLQRTVLVNLSELYLETREPASALPLLEEGLRLAHDPEDPNLEGVFLENLAVVHQLQGQLGTALERLLSAQDLADRIGFSQHRIWRRLSLARLWLDLGDPAGACALVNATSEIVNTAGLGELALEDSVITGDIRKLSE